MLLKDQIGFESARKKIEAWKMFPFVQDENGRLKAASLRDFKPTNQYERILITRMIMEEEYANGSTQTNLNQYT